MDKYLNVGFADSSCCLCTVGDDLTVSKTRRLVDVETNKIKDAYSDCEVEHTYVCKNVWVITKGYKDLKVYLDEEEAKAEYNRIVDEIRKDSKVIDIK